MDVRKAIVNLVAMACAAGVMLPGVLPYGVRLWTAIIAAPVIAVSALIIDEEWRAKREPKAGIVSFSLGLIGLFLMASGLHSGLRDWVFPGIAVAVATAALGTASTWLYERLELGVMGIPQRALLFYFAAGLYALGALPGLNRLLDGSRAAITPLTVTNKTVEGGKSTSYLVNVKPAPPDFSGADYDVAEEDYNRLSIGGRACGYVHRGAFGWRRYDVAPCPGG